MMCSSAKVFFDFVDWLRSLQLFSEAQLNEVLEEFDGVQGVVENGLYISAYEEVARYLARSKSLDEIICFVESSRDVLSELPGEQYYFVESLVDVYSANKLNVAGLIKALPAKKGDRFISPIPLRR